MEKKYYQRLDIIRILSCILVFLYHLKVLEGGFLAVCTFFTLSGYLTTISALKKEKFSLKEYYIKRLKRIYLPLLVTIFLTIIIYKIIGTIHWLNLKQETISSLLGFNNFWQLQTNMDYFTKSINSPFIHFWYISILIQFDLVFPLVFIGIQKLKEKQKNIGIIITSILSILSVSFFLWMSLTKPMMNVYYNTFARSFSIFFGIFLASIHHKNEGKPSLVTEKNHTIIYIFYLILFTACCIILDTSEKAYPYYMIIVTLLSLRLIDYSMLKANQEKKILSYSSNATYEIYLIQYPVIFFISYLLKENLYQIPIIIGITILLGYFIHELCFIKKEKKTPYIIKLILIGMIIIVGGFFLIQEKDHTKEMKALENKLSENLKVMESKNQERLQNNQKREKEWEELINNLDASEKEVVENEINNLWITGIGDSVLLDAIIYFYNRFPNAYFDGKTSRSIYGGISVIKDLKSKNQLGNVVILSLATNTIYQEPLVSQVINLLEGREIYWINNFGGDDTTFNDKFKEYAKDKQNIHIVDWEKAAKDHPEYFYSDGIHPMNEGLQIYVDTVYQTIYDHYVEIYREKKKEILKEKEQAEKEQISFFGNDLLLNAVDLIQNKWENAILYGTSNLEGKTLLEEIQKDKNKNPYQHQIIILLDQNIILTEEDLKELQELTKENKTIVLNLSDKKYQFSEETIKIYNLWDEFQKEEELYLADQIHLSEKGNEKLLKEIQKGLE